MMLNKLSITVGADTKVATLFEQLVPDFRLISYQRPSEYVSKIWGLYQAHGAQDNNLNGKFFECILATLCVREQLLPAYLSAKVAFVPNVIYDLMFYTAARGPICLSIKTSLRERYKQADLEAIALKYVHRKALAYLITLNAAEAKSVKAKIASGDVIGLDDVIVATEPEFDSLIAHIKNSYELSTPPTVAVITSNQVITHEKMNSLP